MHRCLDTRRKILLPLAGLVLALLASCPDALAQRTAAPRIADREEISISPVGHLTVYVRQANGALLDRMAMVTVSMATQQYFRQMVTQGGFASFDDVLSGHYRVEVVAPGFLRHTEEIDVVGMSTTVTMDVVLKPSDAVAAATLPVPPSLPKKAQKPLGVALRALRENKPAKAQQQLQAAYRVAPDHPEVNFLFGVYCAQTNAWPEAIRYWKKTISVYPGHLYALLSLGDALLRENDLAQAATYLKDAIMTEPSSWRAHALYADAAFRQRSYEEAVFQAERALELGHLPAEPARLLLVRALASKGETPRAITELKTHLQLQPEDTRAMKLLETLSNSAPTSVVPPPVSLPAANAPQNSAAAKSAAALALVAPSSVVPAVPLISNWMPADIDENTPPVERSVACNLDLVLQRAGERVQEYLQNVTRYSATETLKHESINSYGMVSATESRQFSYVVDYRRLPQGVFATEEYRDGSFSLERFPEHIATVGLPSQLLIFQKLQAENYDMTCEGLAHSNGALAWQIHFRQRSNKPATLLAYRLGSQSYAVSVKGRAWIAADSYQILRFETGLVSPVPQIALKAQHLMVDYGPVRFRKRNVTLWLPQRAEIYLDWRGHRLRRVHSFDNFLLYTVEESQKIGAPRETQLSKPEELPPH